jgi:hypothetical protein
LLLLLAASAAAQVPAPEAVFGHRMGEDYRLARWEQVVDYFSRLNAASERVLVEELGRTTEDQPYLLVTIGSEANLRRVDELRAAQRRLADPRGLAPEARAEALAAALPVVLVSCNLHSSEVASLQMAVELAHELATATDAQTMEMLQGAILLLVPSANPDGVNKIYDWYQASLGKPWEGSSWMPWLYQKYVGHDNNRDWFMLTQKETRLLTRVMYETWHVNVIYDVHQMGSTGARFFVPPFHDPVSPNVDPLLHQQLLLIGGHMMTELGVAGKKGVVSNAIYDNWWHGGNRTTPYRHNVTGILTEAASARLATPIFLLKDQLTPHSRGLPDHTIRVNFPEPWPGGWWRQRDILEYEKIACRALLTLVVRYRDLFLGQFLQLNEKAVHKGRTEPPFGYLVPAAQRDAVTALRMLEVLHAGGVEVHRATAPFQADGVPYPAGTHVLLAAQPYRNHLKDLMEPQDYPVRFQFPGGPPEAPYDAAGWTLPLQMGVHTVAVTRPFEAPLERIERFEPEPPAAPGAARYGLLVENQSLEAFRLLNRLLARGQVEVRLTDAELQLGGRAHPAGGIVVGAGAERVRELLRQVPVQAHALESEPKVPLRRLRAPRIGLYQPWTASMDEGWTRFVLEQFEFPYRTVHDAEVRAGRLRERYDVLVLTDETPKELLEGRPPDSAPPEYVGGLGEPGLAALMDYAREGGTLVLLSSSARLATQRFGVPVVNVLETLEAKQFFCPGSLLGVELDPSHPLAYGMPREASVYFARSPAFALLRPRPEDKPREGEDPLLEPRLDPVKRYPAKVVGRYAEGVLLRSGWIHGAEHIAGRAALVECAYGRGRLVLFGFRPQHRGQPHGTFRLLFNALLLAGLEDAPQPAAAEAGDRGGGAQPEGGGDSGGAKKKSTREGGTRPTGPSSRRSRLGRAGPSPWRSSAGPAQGGRIRPRSEPARPSATRSCQGAPPRPGSLRPTGAGQRAPDRPRSPQPPARGPGTGS